MCAVAWPNDDWRGEGEMLTVCERRVWREQTATQEELEDDNPVSPGETAQGRCSRGEG